MQSLHARHQGNVDCIKYRFCNTKQNYFAGENVSLIAYKDVSHYFGGANFVTGVLYSQQTYACARQCLSFDFR